MTTSIFANLDKRELVGLQIFKSGFHVSGNGIPKHWSNDELDKMVHNFNNGIPEVAYVKMGHCSDEFVEKLAEELNVPKSAIAGEPGTGRGKAALGRLTKMLRSGDALIANVEMPTKFADMVDNGFLTGVSSEISHDFKGHGPAVSALAMLGAERPAVKGMVSLKDTVLMDDSIEPDLVYASILGNVKSFFKPDEHMHSRDGKTTAVTHTHRDGKDSHSHTGLEFYSKGSKFPWNRAAKTIGIGAGVAATLITAALAPDFIRGARDEWNRQQQAGFPGRDAARSVAKGPFEGKYAHLNDIVAKAKRYGPASLTPEERAQLYSELAVAHV